MAHASATRGMARLSLSASSGQSSFSSYDEDFHDASETLSPPNAQSPWQSPPRRGAQRQFPASAAAPDAQKFSRYRSVRKARNESNAEAPPALDKEHKKSMSRYKRTRPMRPPPPTSSKTVLRGAESNTGQYRAHRREQSDYSNTAQQEAYHILTGGEVDRRPSVDQGAALSKASPMRRQTEDTPRQPEGPRDLRSASEPMQGSGIPQQLKRLPDAYTQQQAEERAPLPRQSSTEPSEAGPSQRRPSTASSHSPSRPSTASSETGSYQSHASPRQMRHDARPSTKSSGTGSWSPLHGPSRTRSMTSDWQPVSPEASRRGSSPRKTAASMDSAPDADATPTRHVTVRFDTTSDQLPFIAQTTTTDLLALFSSRHPSLTDTDTAVLAESLPHLGLERPLRHYERLHSVLDSWDHDRQHTLLILPPSSFTATSDDAVHEARSLSVASAPRTRPAELRLPLYHASKPGRWSARTAILRPDGQVCVAAKPDAVEADWIRIGHMADWDAYIVTGRRKKRLRGERYVVAIKSQQKACRFEKEEDYLHFFASRDKGSMKRWWEGLRAWRAWYLAFELGLAAPPATAAEETPPAPSKPLERAITVSSRHPPPTAQTSERLARSNTTTTTRTRNIPLAAPPVPALPAFAPPTGPGLVAHATNADATFPPAANPVRLARSGTQRTMAAPQARPPVDLTAAAPRTAASPYARPLVDLTTASPPPRPLVDLTAPSAFVKGSLLAGVEAREGREGREREKVKR